jgi:hypothetical protein
MNERFNFGWKTTLPGLLKHMKELENTGILTRKSGLRFAV